MTTRMVEVSKFNGKSWEPSGTAVFHGFFSDYEEFEAGPGNYPAALIEWEDGKIESVVAHSVRFLVPTLELERIKESVQSSWLSKEMRTPAKGFPAINDGDMVQEVLCTWEPISTAPKGEWVLCKNANKRLFEAYYVPGQGWMDRDDCYRDPEFWRKGPAE